MSDPTGNIFLAITTSDGSVHTTTRDATTGKWSAFDTVTTLAGRRNTAVTGNAGIIYATDDNARRPHLWSTRNFLGWKPPEKDVLVGAAPVAAQTWTYSGLLGVTVSGSGYGLPLYLQEPGKTPVLLGDQLTALDKGPVDPSDFPVELSMEGYFGLHEYHYELCMATESGGVFRVGANSAVRTRFEDLKVNAGDPGLVKSVSCSTNTGAPQVCVANDTGALRHTYYDNATRTWSAFSSIPSPAGTKFSRVAASGFNGIGFVNPILHVIAMTDTGGLLHAIRKSDGTWLPFSDVKADAGDPGAVTSLCIDVVQYQIP